MRTRAAMCVGLIALVCLAACRGDAGSGSGAEFAGIIRDSAGVQIVDNTLDGLWADDAGWSTKELLTVGEAAGDPDYQFGQIAAVDVLTDGRIIVLDQQAQRVQVYGPDGIYRESFGGPGNGPGELSPQAIVLFAGRGDTIVVPDMGNQRITLIPPEGEGTSFPLNMEQGIPMGFDMAESGTLVSQRRVMNFTDPAASTDDDMVLAQSYDGTILDTLLTPRRGGSFEITSGGPRFTLFAPEPQWSTLADERIAYASNDAYRISVYGPDGALEQVVTFPHQPRPVTEDDRRIILDLVRSSMEDSGAPSQAIDQMVNSMGFADNWPAFARLRGGPYGTLWVQRLRELSSMSDDEIENWNPQLDQGGPHWDVFEADGRYGGTVELPSRFTPFAFTGDRIYGVFRDEFDVQYVRVYELDTGPRPEDR